jgi:putative transposase
VSRYRFIAAEKATYPVSLLCRTLGVSRASFYAWCERDPSARTRADEQLVKQITRIHRASRGTYGGRRVHAELRDDYGVGVGRKRVARL